MVTAKDRHSAREGLTIAAQLYASARFGKRGDGFLALSVSAGRCQPVTKTDSKERLWATFSDLSLAMSGAYLRGYEVMPATAPWSVRSRATLPRT
jgi:hypothetical protein